MSESGAASFGKVSFHSSVSDAACDAALASMFAEHEDYDDEDEDDEDDEEEDGEEGDDVDDFMDPDTPWKDDA